MHMLIGHTFLTPAGTAATRFFGACNIVENPSRTCMTLV